MDRRTDTTSFEDAESRNQKPNWKMKNESPFISFILSFFFSFILLLKSMLVSTDPSFESPPHCGTRPGRFETFTFPQARELARE